LTASETVPEIDIVFSFDKQEPLMVFQFYYPPTGLKKMEPEEKYKGQKGAVRKMTPNFWQCANCLDSYLARELILIEYITLWREKVHMVVCSPCYQSLMDNGLIDDPRLEEEERIVKEYS
jgi:hypothetical protein